MAACDKKDFETLKEALSCLENWYLKKGKAVQLDGNESYHNNPSKWISFPFMARIYQIHGDTKDIGIERLLSKYKELGNTKDLFVLEDGALRIKGDQSVEGWYCYLKK